MGEKEIEKKKEIAKLSEFTLWFAFLLTATALMTVALGAMSSCVTMLWWGLLLFLLPAFLVALYRQAVVRRVREVVEYEE